MKYILFYSHLRGDTSKARTLDMTARHLKSAKSESKKSTKGTKGSNKSKGFDSLDFPESLADVG